MKLKTLFATSAALTIACTSLAQAEPQASIALVDIWW